MPKPMPVLMDDSRFFTTADMASWWSGLILPVATRLLINSSMASQRLVACKSVMICSLVRMSARSIGAESIRLGISPELERHFKSELLGAAPSLGRVQDTPTGLINTPIHRGAGRGLCILT